MRIVRHPNIVELKAFYYSNGERVGDPVQPGLSGRATTNLLCATVERRGVLESRVGVCTRDRLPCLAFLQQIEDNHAHPRDQDLYLSTFPFTSLYSLSRNLS